MAKIIVAETAQDAFSAKAKNREAVLLGDPKTFISNFLLGSLQKFGVVPFHKDILSLMENQKNLHIHKVQELVKPALLRATTRHRRNNMDILLSDALIALKEDGRDVITTPEGGILFLEFLKEKSETISTLGVEIESDLMHNDMMDIFNDIKNPSFYPIALERALKLFSIFYGKKMEKEKIALIGKFQLELLSEDFTLTVNLEDIKDIIKEQKANAINVQSVNIFDKIIEEIDILKEVLSKEYEIIKDDFVEIKTKDDFSDTFLEMYEEIVY